MLSRIKFNLDSTINEMLDQIPKKVWESKTTTFFDPCMGGGQFARAIENRLRQYGHTEKNISKRVFGCEKLPHRVVYAVNKHKLVGRYIAVDLLNKDSEFKDMKFSVVIGNPPYNLGKDNDFYIKFIHKARTFLEDGGHFGFVIPNRFLNPRSNAAKSMSKWLDADYVMPNVNHHFPGITTDIGAIGGVNTGKPEPRVIPFKFSNGTVINRRWADPCPTVGPNEKSISIIDKIVKSKLPKMTIDNKAQNNYVYLSVCYQRYCPQKPSGGPLHFVTMINATDGLTGSRVPFNSLEEAALNEWFIGYSKLGRFITHCFASTSWATSSPIHHGFMPIIPVTKEDGTPFIQHDVELYNLFGLTADEILYLEDALIFKSKKKNENSNLNNASEIDYIESIS